MYLIRNIHTYCRKDGQNVEIISYFREHVNIVLPFNSMVSTPEEAKKYEFATEAHREKRKYFPGDKSVKVIKHDK